MRSLDAPHYSVAIWSLETESSEYKQTRPDNALSDFSNSKKPSEALEKQVDEVLRKPKRTVNLLPVNSSSIQTVPSKTALLKHDVLCHH